MQYKSTDAPLLRFNTQSRGDALGSFVLVPIGLFENADRWFRNSMSERLAARETIRWGA